MHRILSLVQDIFYSSRYDVFLFLHFPWSEIFIDPLCRIHGFLSLSLASIVSLRAYSRFRFTRPPRPSSPLNFRSSHYCPYYDVSFSSISFSFSFFFFLSFFSVYVFLCPHLRNAKPLRNHTQTMHSTAKFLHRWISITKNNYELNYKTRSLVKKLFRWIKKS